MGNDDPWLWAPKFTANLGYPAESCSCRAWLIHMEVSLKQKVPLNHPFLDKYSMLNHPAIEDPPLWKTQYIPKQILPSRKDANTSGDGLVLNFWSHGHGTKAPRSSISQLHGVFKSTFWFVKPAELYIVVIEIVHCLEDHGN